MSTSVKEVVKEKYGEAARRVVSGEQAANVRAVRARAGQRTLSGQWRRTAAANPVRKIERLSVPNRVGIQPTAGAGGNLVAARPEDFADAARDRVDDTATATGDERSVYPMG